MVDIKEESGGMERQQKKRKGETERLNTVLKHNIR